MLKYEVDKGKISLEMSGTIEELMADVCLLIRCVDEGVAKESKHYSDTFRECMKTMIGDEIVYESNDKLHETAMDSFRSSTLKNILKEISDEK